MKLPMDEIAKLAGRKGVRKIAVENFLMTAGQEGMLLGDEVTNLYEDARLYKWNAATVKAILEGLYKVHSEEVA